MPHTHNLSIVSAPSSPSEWDTAHVCEWLRSVDLEGVVEAMQRTQCSGSMLKHMVTHTHNISDMTAQLTALGIDEKKHERLLEELSLLFNINIRKFGITFGGVCVCMCVCVCVRVCVRVCVFVCVQWKFVMMLSIMITVCIYDYFSCTLMIFKQLFHHHRPLPMMCHRNPMLSLNLHSQSIRIRHVC